MSSSVVVKTPCLVNSLRSPSSIPVSLPGQYSFDPGPGQPFGQQKQKDHHRQEGPDRQPGESNREGNQENCLDIEDQKNDGVEIILRLELDVRFAFRFKT